jgi:hypothetical protein
MATPTNKEVQQFLDAVRETAGDKAYAQWALAARKQYSALRLLQDAQIRQFYVKAAARLSAQVAIARAQGSRDLERLLTLEESLQGTITAIDSGLTGLFKGYVSQAVDIGSTQTAGVLFTITSQAGGAVAQAITPSGIQLVKARVNTAATEAMWSRSVNGLHLSDRIWRTSQTAARTMRDVVRESVALGNDAVETARMLDTYVRGGARTLASKYPNMQERTANTWPMGMTFQEAKEKGLLKPTGRRFPNDVCYESLRLARTETSAAYGEGTITAARMAPSYTGMRWLLSATHPEQDVCDSLSSADFGNGKGVYPPGDEPLQPAHPNCLCALIPVHEKPEDMVKRLRGWVDDPTSDPEIELWNRRVYRGLSEDVATKELELPPAVEERARKMGWIGSGGKTISIPTPSAPAPSSVTRDVSKAFTGVTTSGTADAGATVDPSNAVQSVRDLVDQYAGEYRELAIELSGNLQEISFSTKDEGFFRRTANMIRVGKLHQTVGGFTNPQNYQFEQLFVHEYGHYLDYEIAQRLNPGSPKLAHASSALLDAILADEKRLKKSANKLSAVMALANDHDLYRCPAVSDVFSAVTKRKVQGMYGHPAKRWAEKGAREKEVFADLVDLYSRNLQTQISILRAHCPKTIEAFEQLMVDAAKNVL